MEALTLFTWGYWGWGSATGELVKATDAVEAARGYKPPMFVDIRLSRSVRAPGFRDRAFEELLGSDRYRWLNGLGNLAISEGGATRIKDPAAAETLLELARACASEGRRIIFFCACEHPGTEENPNACHRVTVARLVLEAAARHNLAVVIVEWPGGEPRLQGLETALPSAAFAKVDAGAAAIPLHEPVALAEMAAVPHFSLVVARDAASNGRTTPSLVTGPARYRKGGWYLPNLGYLDEEPSKVGEFLKREREEWGYAPRWSVHPLHAGSDKERTVVLSDVSTKTEGA